MQAIKTTAIVNEHGQLHLLKPQLGLDAGKIVEVIILYQKPDIERKEWQRVLAGIGTYTDEELSGFSEVRKEFDQWHPPEH